MIVPILLVGCSFDPEAQPSATLDMSFVDAADLSDAALPDGADATLRDMGPVSDLWSADAGASDLGSVDMSNSADVSSSDVAASDMTSGGDGVFVLGDRLMLRTELRGDVDDCVAGASCEDVDGDGLVDAWEQLLLDSFRPLVVFDEDEKLFDDPNSVVLHVGRVTPIRRRPLSVQMYLTILYDRDYGSCGSLSSHNGDSERVVVTLGENPSGVRVERVYTAAHEGTITDHSERYQGQGLGELELDQSVPDAARWVVYSSKNKHATYVSKAVCEGTSPLPCFAEDCGPTYLPGASGAMLLDVYNAGEPDSPMLTDLSGIGFPGEDAWADQSFCGGRDRGVSCPGAIREKLTNDPF